MDVKARRNACVRKIIAIAVMMTLIVTGMITIPESAKNAHASGLSSGTGEIIPGNGMVDMLRMKKTIDLSNSSVNITLTDDEKAKITADADEGVIKWLVSYVFAEVVGSGKEGDEFKKATGFADVTNGVKFYSPMFWYEDVYDTVVKKLDEIIKAGYGGYDQYMLDNLKKLVDLGTATKLLATKDEELQEFAKCANDDYSLPGSLSIRAKRESIYNDKLSEFITAKISKELNAAFSFNILPIASDGSEDNKYGIGKKTSAFYAANGLMPEAQLAIKRGSVANNKYKLSEVDFGASDQFYDEILLETIDEYLSGALIGESYGDASPLPDDDDWEGGKSFKFGMHKDGYYQRDLMGYITHVLQIDGGDMRSSDDSQHSYAGLRGSTTFGGWRCLLEVCDSLDAYAWGRYIFPADKYTQTFNLHLNPAVTYVACNIRADLVTGLKFNKSGKLISVSKPLATENDLNKLTQSMEDDYINTEPGIYRFKLVEGANSTSALANGDKFVKNTEEKIVDVVVTENGSISGENDVKVFFFDDLASADKFYQAKFQGNEELNYDYYIMDKDTELLTSAQNAFNVEFTNKFEKDEENPPEKDKPEITKTIKGSKNFTIAKLSEKFAYRITTSIPKTADSFQVVDDMDKVLEFVEKGKTTVKIGDKVLTADELKKQLTQNGNTLKLTITDDQLKNRAGEKITIDFRAKIVDGADLSGYNGVVPNVAYYVMDGEESTKVGTANVKLPTYKTPAADDEDDENNEADDESESGSSYGFARTGDYANIAVWAALLIGAVLLAVFMAVRKRKANNKE